MDKNNQDIYWNSGWLTTKINNFDVELSKFKEHLDMSLNQDTNSQIIEELKKSKNETDTLKQFFYLTRYKTNYRFDRFYETHYEFISSASVFYGLYQYFDMVPENKEFEKKYKEFQKNTDLILEANKIVDLKEKYLKYLEILKNDIEFTIQTLNNDVKWMNKYFEAYKNGKVIELSKNKNFEYDYEEITKKLHSTLKDNYEPFLKQNYLTKIDDLIKKAKQ